MQYNIVGINTNDKPFSFSFSSIAYEAVDVLNKRLVGNLNPSKNMLMIGTGTVNLLYSTVVFRL